MATTPEHPTLTLLLTAAPALLLLWLTTLIALALWRRHITNTSTTPTRKAAHHRTHARTRIIWHTLTALTITSLITALPWPTALAAAPLLIPPLYGIVKWTRTARTLTQILNAARHTTHPQPTR